MPTITSIYGLYVKHGTALIQIKTGKIFPFN
jgi:hypothetical protein